MANNAANVTTGKPKVGGAVFRAPAGTTLPTDTSTALNDAFKNLGYISEDGVTVSTALNPKSIKAWGGDVVYSASDGKEDKVKLKLLEVINDEVLKAVYVDANVSGALSTGLTVNVNAKDQPDCCWAIDQVLRGGVAKRIVIPKGKIVELGDVVYKDGDAVGYEITILCQPDSSENTRYEYLKAAST